MWPHSLKVAQLLRSAACLHTNQSRSYLNDLVFEKWAQKGIIGPQRVEATAEWRKTENEMLLGRTNQCVCDDQGI